MSIIYNGNRFDLDESTSNGLAHIDSPVNGEAEGAEVGDAEVEDAEKEPRSANDATDFNYIIIQSTDALSDGEMTEMSSHGVEFKEHLSGNAWRCRFRPEDLSVIRSLGYIEKVAKFPAAPKVSPSLRQHLNSSTSDAHVDIVLHGTDDATASDVAQHISNITGTSPENMVIRNEDTVVRIHVSPDKLLEIAGLDNVGAVQEVVELVTCNNVAREILRVEIPKSFDKTQDIGQGSGQIVTVADTGFDKGDPDKPHPAFVGRVKKLIPIGRPMETDDLDGHGTHVCGSVLGNGKSDPMGVTIQGTAPKAELIVQALRGPNPKKPLSPNDPKNVLFSTAKGAEVTKLFASSYALGSRVHNNSWATRWDHRNSQMEYTKEGSEAIDTFVWGHPDMTICFAAGNNGRERTQKGHIGGHSSSKNCITIGSCNNSRTTFDLSFVRYTHGGKFTGNPNDVSVFSSRGPTKEDRIKPDVIAPGSMILSTASRGAEKKLVDYGISSDDQWAFSSGTSMSTPLIAGCAAVLREGLLKGKPPTNPSAALVKAMLINGATLLNLPHRDQGFGRVDMAQSIIIPGTTTGRAFWESKVPRREPRASEMKTIAISQYLDANATSVKTATLKATLVYNDLAGASLQINLNLIVRSIVNGKAQVRHGNAEPPDKPDAYDTVNNVEQVVWTGLPANATVTLEVANRQFFLNTVHEAPFAVVWAVTPEQVGKVK